MSEDAEEFPKEPVKEPRGEPVLDWDRIVHKNVRSKDRADVGNVDAVDEKSIVIITEGARGEYKIPKSEVDGFDGAEVFLKSTLSELRKFKV